MSDTSVEFDGSRLDIETAGAAQKAKPQYLASVLTHTSFQRTHAYKRATHLCAVPGYARGSSCAPKPQLHLCDDSIRVSQC